MAIRRRPRDSSEETGGIDGNHGQCRAVEGDQFTADFHQLTGNFTVKRGDIPGITLLVGCNWNYFSGTICDWVFIPLPSPVFIIFDSDGLEHLFSMYSSCRQRRGAIWIRATMRSKRLYYHTAMKLTIPSDGNARFIMYLLAGLLAVQGIIFWASVYQAPANEDEMWFAEEAFFLARDGYVHSQFFKGFLNKEERVMVYHRLLVRTESLLIKLFGFHLATIRLVPLASSLAVLLLLFVFARKNFDLASALFAVLFYWMMKENFYAFKIARPEMMVAALGFGTFLLIEQSKKRAPVLFAVLAGLCAGCTAYTHLNAVIIILAGGLFLLLKRRFAQALLFGSAAAVALAPYALDVFRNYVLFHLQFTSPFFGTKTQMNVARALSNLAGEQKRYFWNTGAVTVSFVMMGCLAINAWLYVTKKHAFDRTRDIYLFTLCVFIFLAILVSDKRPHYATILFPFFALIAAETFFIILRGSVVPKKAAAGFAIPAAFFFFVNIGMETTEAFFGPKQDLAALNRSAGSHLPAGASCAAPMNFIFEEIHRVNISALLLANYLTDSSVCFADYKITPKSLSTYCRAKDLDYAVITKYSEKHDRIRLGDKRELEPFFTIVAMNDDYTVLKRKLPGGNATPGDTVPR